MLNLESNYIVVTQRDGQAVEIITEGTSENILMAFYEMCSDIDKVIKEYSSEGIMTTPLLSHDRHSADLMSSETGEILQQWQIR